MMQNKHIANTMKTLHTLKAPRQCTTGGLASPVLSPKLMAFALIISLTRCDRIQSLKGEVQEKAQAVASQAAQRKTDVAELQEEVRLHDDQFVVVKRRAVACAGGFPNSSRSSDLEFESATNPWVCTGKAQATDTPGHLKYSTGFRTSFCMPVTWRFARTNHPTATLPNS